jgi:hypothetical protein
MKIYQYEGGIPYEVEVPEPSPRQMAAFEKFLATMPCSCKGEAHDECALCDDCGEPGALNSDGENGLYCDECWEALVEAEEAEYNMMRAEQEEFDRMYEEMREDHEAMKFDAWWQEQKENRS